MVIQISQYGDILVCFVSCVLLLFFKSNYENINFVFNPNLLK